MKIIYKENQEDYHVRRDKRQETRDKRQETRDKEEILEILKKSPSLRRYLGMFVIGGVLSLFGEHSLLGALGLIMMTAAMVVPVALSIGLFFLKIFLSKYYIESNSFVENFGLVLAFACIIGVFALSCVTVVAAVIFGIFLISRKDKLKSIMMNRGFGKGVIIYAIWILFICGILSAIDGVFDSSMTMILITLLIGIIGLFVLPKVSSNAKKAAPFILFMLTIGILLLKINAMSSNNDNSNTSSGDSASAFNTDTAVASAATAVSAANFDNTNVNVADTNSSFGDFSTGTNTVNMDTVNSNVNPTMITDTNVDYNNYTTSTANTDFNTPEPKSTTTYQYTDGNNNFNVNMQADGSGTITSDDNQPMGTVEQKGNTTIVKDENGNVISTKDNINGFVYDDKGMPQGIVDDNKSVNSYYDVNSGNNTVETNGHIIDSEGNQGTIKKK